MGFTMPKPRSSDPVRSLDGIRPTSAKAGLPSETAGRPSDQIGLSYTEAQHAAILSYYGSVKATAYALGEGAKPARSKLDESLMQREFRAGNFARFDAADQMAKASVAARLNAVFGDLTNPRDFALRAIEEVEDRLRTIRQIVMEVAS